MTQSIRTLITTHLILLASLLPVNATTQPDNTNQPSPANPDRTLVSQLGDINKAVAELREWERAFYLGMNLSIAEGLFERNSYEHYVWLFVAKKADIEAGCEYAECDPQVGYAMLKKGRDALAGHRREQKLEQHTQIR